MRPLRALAVLLALFALAGAAAGRAQGVPADDEHDSAYRAVKQGHVLPLIDILEKARPLIGDEIVGVDFEGKASKPFYEIYFIDKKGRRREAFFDARTGDPVHEPDE
jgi:hypothetical protein